MDNIIIPSILNCSLSKVEKDLINLFKNGVTHLHFDVMDGSLTQAVFDGFQYISSISDILDAYGISKNIHLLTKHPEKYLNHLANLKVEQISFHIDAFSANELMDIFSEFKCKVDEVGIVVKPSDVNDLTLLQKIDFAHVCDRDYLSNKTYSIDDLSFIISSIRPNSKQIQIDGGVSSENIKFYQNLGATYFIVGAGIFSSEPLTSYNNLKNILKK